MEFTLGELAQLLNGQLVGDPQVTVTQICPMSNAQAGDVSFLSDKKFRSNLAECKASVILINAADQEFCQTNAILVDDPYLAYAKTAQALDSTPSPASDIAATAVIHETAKLGARVCIGANSVIEAGVELADDVVIGAGCFVGKNSKLGQGSKLWANVTVYHGVTIGDACLFQSGAVIGSDGFGYARDKDRWQKIPQLGGVRIGNRVEIGACTTVDRGSLNDTVIEDDVILDNQLQVAHNVHIGAGTAMAGGTIIAGSVRIGKNCMIGGASVINGHIEIADGCNIGGMSVIAHSIKTTGSFAGYPAHDRKKAAKNLILMMRLDEMNNRIRALEKQS